MGKFDRNFKRDRPGRGNFDRKGPREFARREDGPLELHKAVCVQCGKDCEVPFRPSQGKPVYCRDCFKERGGEDGPRPERPSSGVFEQINKKLDRILGLLEGHDGGEEMPRKKVWKKRY